MVRNVLIVLMVVAALVVLGTVAKAARAAAREAEVKKMTDAMPTKAPATPAKPRKVLVYSHCNGFYHGSIPVIDKAFEIMGSKTGAFTAVVSNDLSNFERDKIKQFDAIIFNNTTGELFKSRAPRKPRKPSPRRVKDPEKLKQAMAKYEQAVAKWEEQVKKLKAKGDRSEALRKSLMEWVRSGKGVIGTHAATDCSYSWKEWGQMMGGRFSGHPWGGGSTVTIKLDDPKHPVNAAFGGKGMTFKEEIYQFNRGVYNRKDRRVLVTLDMTKTRDRGKRKDKDYAVSWVKTHGQGRVFYCSIGHNSHHFWTPEILGHYLAGIQWAIGDLKAETTPNPLPAAGGAADK